MTSDKKCENISKLIENIHFGKIKGSYKISVATISTLKNVIKNSKWDTARDLMDLIQENGKCLSEAFPIKTPTGNMVKRVLQIIREEYTAESNAMKTESTRKQESLRTIFTSSESYEDEDFRTAIPTLKAAIIEHIEEYELELENCPDNITSRAPEHIHSEEVILTLGRSELVEDFLKTAAVKRSFQVIVVEGGPFLHGHTMAMNLTKAKINTTVIPDAAVFAMMSRVNKVIIGTHSVMANGGLRAMSGSRTVAQAAKHYSVPVMVLMPLYKLTPLFVFSHEQPGFNEQVSPLQGVFRKFNAPLLEKVQSFNPVIDYVPPELVTLFITNQGGHEPSYIYRLLTELYHPDDREL